ncbi:hypothetical protein KPL35_05110 [Clostridium sp. CF011]|uniref:hypothetical protein n=1 Tax=Clostridium sp. CF011 TaxID=2843318 RepID=UPI001C0B834C|nr:hypothetical protein [Clostridium sp. CF011]MBU3091449.1 hypothetical protein [Clostridium sp. CF011]WAG69258.1 hypothetical protein LL036_14825 [Clostridium sp. CF011]
MQNNRETVNSIQYGADGEFVSSMSDEIGQASQNQAQLAQKLNELVQKFKV